MQVLDTELLKMVGGGLSTRFSEIDPGTDGGGGISFSDYWDSRVPDYEIQANYDGSRLVSQSMRNGASMVASAAGWGAGSVVFGTCVLAPSLLAGPAAPEVAALLTRPCAAIGAAAGTYAGIWVNGQLQARLKMMEQ